MFQERLIPFTLLALLFLFASFKIPNAENNGADLLNKLIDNSENIHGLELTMLMKERLENEYISKKAQFKVLYQPFSIYVKQFYPNNFEVLFRSGENNNKAWVKPDSFPWTTLSLSPIGGKMRNRNHHSIYKAGYKYLISVLDHLKTKFKENADECFKYEGLVRYNNQICYKVIFNNPSFSYYIHKTEQTTSLEELSNKFKLNDYRIVELNPELRGYEPIKAGKSIKVPSDYGKTIILYINKDKKLLDGIKVFDDLGLWEDYTYTNVKLNPEFSGTDFNINNPEYSF